MLALKTQNLHSDFFYLNRGVKQGDSLRPTLFNVHINDIEAEFSDKVNQPVQLIDTKLGCLLFADDLLILSETKDGLQNSLNNLENYCTKWQLTLNVRKTKTMVLQSNRMKIRKC